jgi:Kef-type K+ transport system membrane component KefB
MRRDSVGKLLLLAGFLLGIGYLFGETPLLWGAGSEGAVPVAAVREAAQPTGHSSPVAPVLLAVVVILLAARLGGHFFETFGQPSVLGELVVGILLGNLALLGFHQLDFLRIDYDQMQMLHLENPWHCAGVTIDQLSRLGVLLLLFQVGLETSVVDLRRVGVSAFLVAVLGVVTPIALGWLCGWLLMPSQHWTVHMFLGATLAATSVGITARVLRDLGKTESNEARIILGAAVIDDVLGLLVLALAQGVITTLSTGGSQASFDWLDLLVVIGKAVTFLVGALVLGQYVSRPVFKMASYLQGSGILVVTALAFCFTFAWLADAVGLAPIVGAFAAGLVLEKVHYRELAARDGEHDLEELIRPVADLLVPLFFVMIGFQVNLRSFASWQVLGLASALTLAAVLGKQVCSLGIQEKGVDRLSVGLGMIPRGEVGIIFASIGRQLRIGDQRVVDDGTYAALVLMVMVTTMITPPLLKWSLARRDHGKQETMA